MRRLATTLALALAVGLSALCMARYFLGVGSDGRRGAGLQLPHWLQKDETVRQPTGGGSKEHPKTSPRGETPGPGQKDPALGAGGPTGSQTQPSKGAQHAGAKAHVFRAGGGKKPRPDKASFSALGGTPATGSLWLGNTPLQDVSAAEAAKMSAPPAAPRASRRHDFVLCANVAGTLGSSLQAAKAFLTIAARLQQRGWRVRVVLPAIAGTEFDDFRMDENGTSLARMLDLTPLRKLFDIDEGSAASTTKRKEVCWERGCDVAVFSLVQIWNEKLRQMTVPHIWLGPGYEQWMFENLFDNLGTLANAPDYSDAIRVFWQMRSESPTECSPFVYPDLANEVARSMVLKLPEQPERCAFVYVGPIIRRDRLWHLRPGPNFTKWCPQCSWPDLPAWVNATARKIGVLLQGEGLTCANFYVRLLGLNSTEFLHLVQEGATKAGVPFEASRIKKRSCRLCAESNMEILQRAAASPLLLADYGSFWPDLPAMHLLSRGSTVAYLHGDVDSRNHLLSLQAEARRSRRDSGRDLDPRNDVALGLLRCKEGLIYRGRCIDYRDKPSGRPLVQSDTECWPEDQPG